MRSWTGSRVIGGIIVTSVYLRNTKLRLKIIISTGYNIGFKSLNVPVIAAAEPPPPDIDEERPTPPTALAPAAERATALVMNTPSSAVKNNY